MKEDRRRHPASAAPAARPKRVLYVEDEDKWHRVVSRILVAPEFDLQIVNSFAEAQPRLNESFDLIISNLCLEGDRDFMGEEIIEDCSRHQVPSMVLTGSAIPTRGLFERYPCLQEVYVKGSSFNSREFLQAVRRAIAAGQAKAALAPTPESETPGPKEPESARKKGKRGGAGGKSPKKKGKKKSETISVPPSPAVFSWLHLSDWHIGHKDETRGWETLKETLLTDLREHQAPPERQAGHLAGVSFHPNAIFVTGDIAFQAATSEYDEAEKLLQEIWKITGLSKAETFIVPGNHDVDRKAVVDNYLYSLAYDRLADPTLEDDEWLKSLNQLWRQTSLRQWMQDKFAHYLEFVKRCTDTPPGQLYYAQSLAVGDKRVGILGLNSALMSWKDGEDHQRCLWIGRPQINEVHKSLGREEAAYIALVHHPHETLHPCDSSWDWLEEKCAIVLHGHMHKVKAVRTQQPDRDSLCLPGGAVYEKGLWNSQHYTYGQFDLNTRSLDLYLRMTKPGEDSLYVRDGLTYPKAGPDGHVALRLKT